MKRPKQRGKLLNLYSHNEFSTKNVSPIWDGSLTAVDGLQAPQTKRGRLLGRHLQRLFPIVHLIHSDSAPIKSVPSPDASPGDGDGAARPSLPTSREAEGGRG